MRLATVRISGSQTAAVVGPGGAVPVGRGGEDLLPLIEAGLGQDALQNRAEPVPAGGFTYAPPYRRPRKIWGIGLNYAAHAGDLDEKPPEQEPASFMRPDTTIIGHGDAIVLPEGVGRVTAEAELGLVIGHKARDVLEEDAFSVLAGYTCVLDMTAEDVLRRNPRYLTRAKSHDTFFSFGPELVTPDEVDDLAALQIATVKNGELVRANTVVNMTFSPAFLVAFHSRVMTLLPGDVISTGTPGAVEIEDGDLVECRIGGFETLSNSVVSEGG